MTKVNTTISAWRAAGACLRCGGFRDRPNRTICSVCAQRVHDLREGKRDKIKPGPKTSPVPELERRHLRREEYRKAGVCIRCQGPRDRGNRDDCAACFDLRRILYGPNRRAAYIQRREEVQAVARQKRIAWKAVGLCSLCGHDRDNPTLSVCADCRQRSMERCRTQRLHRLAAGLCPKCGKRPPLPGKRSCADCIEAMKAAYRKAYLRDPAAFLARLHTRRTRKLGNGGSFTAAEWLTIVRLQDHTCLMCGRKEPDITLTVDHVIPVSLGGPSWAWNLQALCLSCNTSKGDNYLDLRPNGPWI